MRHMAKGKHRRRKMGQQSNESKELGIQTQEASRWVNNCSPPKRSRAHIPDSSISQEDKKTNKNKTTAKKQNNAMNNTKHRGL